MKNIHKNIEKISKVPAGNAATCQGLTDKELYEKCKFFGARARKWMKKFGALLFEVERRQLYKKYGFHSIFEFAAKLAGLKHETVMDILRVSRKLEDKPLLKAQMEEHGWAKLRLVANIATKENEKILAEKVKEMSKPTLETFIKELRQQNSELVQNRPGTAEENGKFLPLESQKGLFLTESEPEAMEPKEEADHVRAWQKYLPARVSVRINLKPETDLRLRKLQKKLSEKYGGPVDFNEVMETLLDAYKDSGKFAGRKKKIEKMQKTEEKNDERLELEQKKPESILEQTAKENLAVLEQKAREKVLEMEDSGKKCGRYIPVAIKKFLYEKYHGRCAFEGCMKLQEIYHHTRRFALNASHDPLFLAPLCKGHERLAHHGLIENEEKSPSEWRVLAEANKASPKYFIDQKVQGFRRSN